MYNIVNIVEYVFSGSFFEYLNKEKLFDIVILESKKYLLEDVINKNYSFKLLFLDDINYDFGLSGILDSILNNKKKILLILNKLNSFYILPFLNKIDYSKLQNLSIINLNVGVVSKVEKYLPEYNDIGIFLDYNFDVYEPVDLLNLFEILKENKKNYIRISNKDYPIDIFKDNQREVLDGIINFIDWGVSGNKGTILVFGYMIPQVLQALEVLNSDGLFFDLFGIYKYNFSFSEEIINSLRNTEKMIAIYDSNSINFLNLLKAKLYDINMCEIMLDAIIPKYNDIQTSLLDYIFSNAKFDYLNLVDRIKKLL